MSLCSMDRSGDTMNANELADDLDHVYELSNIFECKAGADTIRQQQAEIETYKLELYDEVMLRREQQAEIEALKAENKQLTEWLTKVGFVK